MLLKILTLFLPWSLRRRALKRWFKFDIHPHARIGLAWVFPRKLIMAADSRIHHLTVAINLDCIEVGAGATIGRGNWITGFSTNTASPHFQHDKGRCAKLIVGESAIITKNHHFDCTNLIDIGRFTTMAGYQSQFLTHSIDVTQNRQDSAPIIIGEHTFVGTNVTVLGGAVLPARSVLGAKSLLNKEFTIEWTVYGGVPAKALQQIAQDAKYFSRADGFVV